MNRLLFLLVFSLVANLLPAQSASKLADSLKSGFRGLSAVDDNVIWMSGRKGLVGVTVDGGKKWKWNRVKEFDKLDFRSLYAFDKKRAMMASAGTPAVILETMDGGKKWTTRYRSDDSAMFFDGMAFWDESHGLIFGDPVNGRMFLMETIDGGKTWKEIPFEQRPKLENGEAAFAASGTTIRVLPGGHVWIATGGTVSRLWHSRDYGRHWEVRTTPIIQGQASTGIFSFAFRDTLHGIIVGGDYTHDTLKKEHVFFTDDGGKTWRPPCIATGGYRSCVEFIGGGIVLATGTSGSDISYDDGVHWEPYGSKGANTIQRSRKGSRVFVCGGRTGFGSLFFF